MSMQFEKITDLVGRRGTVLSNDKVRVLVENWGGMTPEFSYKNDCGYVNTHLIPPFRGSSCQFDEEKHGEIWGIKLPHELAGNFPCFPTFGNESKNRGYVVPPCGHTANLEWEVLASGACEEYAFQVAVMGGEETNNIFYTKYDILLPEHNVHYQVMKIRNERPETFMFGGAWHNTTGQPFLEKGCILSASADLYHTSPVSHDPQQKEQLELNREFQSLKAAPGKNGKLVDISVVPGMIGYTDFLTGRIPQSAKLGWMAVVNPNQDSIYCTFFKGPAIVPNDEFTFYFNHIWLQYGGRNYMPWASYEGGVDRCFALGVESAISAWGYGLDYCDEHPTVMGNPTILPLLAGEEKTLYHGTLIGRIHSEALNNGVSKVEKVENGLCFVGENGNDVEFLVDSGFEKIKLIVKEIEEDYL
ncbi:MAG: hypothetical protein ACRC37_06090 [Lentisphaeria bacterium]